MKFTLTIVCLNLVTILNGFSQQTDSIFTKQDTSSGKNAIYLEYSGTAPILSLNYERKLFHKNIFSIYGRIGFGMDVINLNQGNLYVPSVPIEISTCIGRGNHFVELGIGGTPFLSKMETWSSAAYYDDLQIDSIEYKLYFLFTPRIGYRYQSKKGWLLRVAYTPILYNSSNLDDNYQTNFGLSLGKLF